MRRLLVTLMLSGMLLMMMVTPALAHIHVTVPASSCANSEMAANNPQARESLATRGAVAQGAQTFPVGNAQGGANSQAAEHCGGPHEKRYPI